MLSKRKKMPGNGRSKGREMRNGGKKKLEGRRQVGRTVPSNNRGQNCRPWVGEGATGRGGIRGSGEIKGSAMAEKNKRNIRKQCRFGGCRANSRRASKPRRPLKTKNGTFPKGKKYI